MTLILKIAWRNILRHRGKSIIIGVILFLGSLLMTIGNGVIEGMELGLRKNIINSFTADIVIISQQQQDNNVFMSFMGKAIEPIYNFIDIKKVLEKQNYIDKFLPIGKNAAMLFNEDGGNPGFAYLLGVNFSNYRNMFADNLKVIEGDMIENIEKGIVLPTGARNRWYEFTNIWFIPQGCLLDTANVTTEAKKNINELSIKNEAVFMGFSNDNTTTDIRLPIKAVVKYKALNQIWGHFVLVDIESYRQCMGYFTASEKVEVSEEKKGLFLMDESNLDQLFESENLFVENKTPSDIKAIFTKKQSVDSMKTQIGFDIDAGAYNMVLVKLKKNINPKTALQKINTELEKEKLGVRAILWNKALGAIGSMVLLIKGSLFVFVSLLFFVAVIIIINTLSMAALERSSEIGMMRAVGALKGFISKMFLGETALLSAIFGGAGVIVGFLIIKIISALRITTSNDMLQLLYGGDTFAPSLTIEGLILTVIQLVIVTFISVLYPIKIARGITPLDAVSRD